MRPVHKQLDIHKHTNINILADKMLAKNGCVGHAEEHEYNGGVPANNGCKVSLFYGFVLTKSALAFNRFALAAEAHGRRWH